MKLKVVELFAGVGGFRIGLEKTKKYEIIWSNQWEPLTKVQHASMVYENKFGKEGHSNKNIEEVKTKDIPDCDLLVGGFPCQDYSVANSISRSGGIEGKKGVLWWSIFRILKEKKNKPKFLILENVDRLLKSPAKQRGRDYAIMLSCLNQLNYAVEWRVINAAEYGFPQKRRRIFIVAYLKGTSNYDSINKDPITWIKTKGVISKAFPILNPINPVSEGKISKDVIVISESFNKNGAMSPFNNCGIMIKSKYYTFKSFPDYKGPFTVLKDIIEDNVDKEFFINKGDELKWKKFKDRKSEKRITKEGFVYNFSEGKMDFPDKLDKPSRTIITSEGGATPSRTKHVIETKQGLRRLTPRELEKLNGFNPDHTKLKGISDSKRAFFMGNALVVGIVKNIGEKLV